MLTVIAIIAVLAAVLLPALAKAKAEARRVECISRMKQWTLAFRTYTDDNEDQIPREGYHNTGRVVWNNWNMVTNAQSDDVWYNALADYMSVEPASSYHPETSRLRFYERSSMFHCPSARFSKLASPQIALFSIAMNSQLIEWPNVPTVSFARIQQDSQTVLFLENLLEEEARVVEQQAWDNLGQPAATADRFAGRRHGSRGNLAFADGSVSSFQGRQVVETDQGEGKIPGWIRLPEDEIKWHLP